MTFNAAGSPGHPERVLERLFLEGLEKERPKLNIVSGERVDGVYRRISADSLTISQRDVLRKVGSELGVEGIVAGYVYRFRERKGVSYTVEQPASAFEVSPFELRANYTCSQKNLWVIMIF